MSNLDYNNCPYYSLIILASNDKEYNSEILEQPVEDLHLKKVHFIETNISEFKYLILIETFTSQPNHLTLHNDCFSASGELLYEETNLRTNRYPSSLKIRRIKKSSITPKFYEVIENRIIILESKLEDVAFLISKKSGGLEFEEFIEVTQIELNETLENNNRNSTVIVHEYPNSNLLKNIKN